MWFFHILYSMNCNSVVTIQTNKCTYFLHRYNNTTIHPILHVSGPTVPISGSTKFVIQLLRSKPTNAHISFTDQQHYNTRTSNPICLGSHRSNMREHKICNSVVTIQTNKCTHFLHRSTTLQYSYIQSYMSRVPPFQHQGAHNLYKTVT